MRYLAAVVLIAALAGCGHTTTIRAGHAVELALTEYRITPQDVRTPGGEVDLLVHNYGRLVHNLVLTSAGHQLAITKPIGPGQSTWLFVELAPGRYVMASNLFSDQDLGLYGTLIVTR
ncbi:MAG TPA: cupredoxin domain-containing protein [Solirubrobacteraceae bacterium]|nr:cupredoxin domain-containing protein [Solirubrobacteraceae bacterium]